MQLALERLPLFRPSVQTLGKLNIVSCNVFIARRRKGGRGGSTTNRRNELPLGESQALPTSSDVQSRVWKDLNGCKAEMLIPGTAENRYGNALDSRFNDPEKKATYCSSSQQWGQPGKSFFFPLLISPLLQMQNRFARFRTPLNATVLGYLRSEYSGGQRKGNTFF